MYPCAELCASIRSSRFVMSSIKVLPAPCGLQTQVVELIAALGDDLVSINPDIAVASQDVNMGAGFPVGVGLAAVRVTEGDVHAGKFFVLKENADHLGEAEVSAEG